MAKKKYEKSKKKKFFKHSWSTIHSSHIRFISCKHSYFSDITKSMVKEQLLFHARTVICLQVSPATNIMSQVIIYHYDGVSLPHRFYTKSVSKSWGALLHMSKSWIKPFWLQRGLLLKTTFKKKKKITPESPHQTVSGGVALWVLKLPSFDKEEECVE